MINEILSDVRGPHISFLDGFKYRLVRKTVVNNNFLLDLGCGGGSFIFHSRKIFKEVGGVEISDVARNFADKRLGVTCRADILDFNNTFSFVTAWHSLEHMTTASLTKSLRAISVNSSPDMAFIVSVPNAESLQCRFFGNAFAFYDNENHLHQFSARSLDALLGKFDFIRERIFISFPYNIFGYMQSFLNIFNPVHNYLYRRKKRGEAFLMNGRYIFMLDCYNILLTAVFIVPAAILAFWDALFPLRGGVITLCYRKKERH